MKMKNIGWIRCGVLLLLICLALSLCGCTPALSSEDPQPSAPSLALPYRNANIAIGNPVEPLLEVLGNDYTLQEAASCAGIGKDYVYSYPSLRLYVFAPENGEAVVTSACYTDDGVAMNGVAIGSSAAVAIEQFGTPAEQTESKLAYHGGKAVLTLTLRDGVITGIVLSEK